MDRLTIRLIIENSYLANVYGNEKGELFLDVPLDISLRVTNVLEELTEAAEVRQSAALTTSIKQTPKNKALLEQFEANVLQRNATYLEVEVKAYGELLPLNKLRVNGDKDSTQDIEIELLGAGWIQDIRQTQLKTLDLGTYHYTNPNVLASWTSPTDLAQPLLADFGAWSMPGNVTRKDLRMAFNLVKLMKEVFCSSDWVFKSPYWEGIAGSKNYGYLHAEDWYSYSGKTDQYAVHLNIDPVRSIPAGPITGILFDEIFDPFNLYNGAIPSAYIYPPAGLQELQVNFEVEGLQVTLPPYGAITSAFVFTVLRYDGTGSGDYFFTLSRLGSATETVTLNLDFDFSDDESGAGKRYFVSMGYVSTDPTNPQELGFDVRCNSFWIRPNPPYFVDDDTIPLADLIDQELNGEDLFKAIAHPLAGKVVTDYIERTVTLYTPYDATVQGEPLEGFFKPTKPAIDLTKYVVPNSRETKNRTQGRTRFIDIKWADSSDAFIDQREIVDPFSKRVDLGSGDAKPTELVNPLFEPTMERSVPAASTGSNFDVQMPAIWDNEDGDLSTKVGKRILHFYGPVVQRNESDLSKYFTFEGSAYGLIPYFAQVSGANLLGPITKHQLAFIGYEDDFFEIAYQKYVYNYFTDLDFEFLLYIDSVLYQSLTFRDKIGIFYNDTYLLYQLAAIRDYALLENTSTPIDVKPINC